MKKGEHLLTVLDAKGFYEPAGWDKLARRRGAIIDDILQGGLKPSAQLVKEDRLYFGSADTELSTVVSGIHITPASSKPRERYQQYEELRKSLHSPANSVFSVIGERLGESPFSTDHANNPNYAQRLSASFIAVCRFKRIGAPRERHGIFFHAREETIPPENFVYLIFPQAIWEEYCHNGGNAQSNAVPTSIIEGKRREEMLGPYNVPDYQSGVWSVMNEVNDYVWIHGVRLPTLEDLDKAQGI